MVTNDLDLPEDLALDPTTAPLAGKGSPLPPGNYEVVIKKFQQEKLTRDGQPALKTVKGKAYRQAQIDSLQVISPFPANGRNVYIFQAISTVPKQRQGKWTTELFDVLMAFDQTRGVSGVDEGLELLAAYVATEKPITVHTTLSGLDMAYVKSFEGMDQTKEQKNEMWTKARLGVKDFISPTGQVLAAVRGPSGEMIEPRVEINVFYPSEAKVKLGADSERNK